MLLVGPSEAELRALRGDRIAMIPQDALRALNPVLRIDRQVGEPYVIHRGSAWAAARSRAVELLADVHLREPGRRAQEYPPQFSGGMQQRAMIAMGLALEPELYPHQLSGGQRQRVAIARAIIHRPSLVLADEPTSALDVSVQAQILNLFKQTKRELGLTYVFVSHNLGVIRYISDRMAVMYQGRIVEAGPSAAIFTRPEHAYTKTLLDAVPDVDPDRFRTAVRQPA